jgi:hypothetical protein
MSWRRSLQATIHGAAITLGSTVISCGLAIQVEASAHRLLFWCAPEKYANVEYAYGLEHSQLDSVRHLATNRPVTALHTEEYRVDQLPSTIYSGADELATPRSKSDLESASWFTRPNSGDDSSVSLPPMHGTEGIMRQEILASAMTG